MRRGRPSAGRRWATVTTLALLVAVATLVTTACEYTLHVGEFGEPADATVQDAGTSKPESGGGTSHDGMCTRCGDRCCPNGVACVDSRGRGRCATDIVEVSSGTTSACAVVANGDLWCWGDNQYGEIGVGPEGDDVCVFGGGDVACRVKPTKVQGLGEVVHVSAGTEFICAVTKDKSVWCWGKNVHGVLGHAPGTMGDQLCPAYLDAGAPFSACNVTPQRVPDLSASEVAANMLHACALSEDGGVACWGDNSLLQLGTHDVDGGTFMPQRVQGLPPVAHVRTSLFGLHSCAVGTADGSVWCWGFTAYGQLGHPQALDTECSGGCSLPRPVSTTVVDGDAAVDLPFTGAIDVQPGLFYTCALKADGTVWCWGSEHFGTLGVEPSPAGERRSPVQVQKLPVTKKLAARFEHVCALADTGEVWCWGDNTLGSLGLGSIDSEPCSGQLCKRSPQPTGVRGVTDITAGTATTFVLKSDDTLWAWGSNDTARLAHRPLTLGDLTNCGDNLKSVCNPVPRPIDDLPIHP
jgi:alpha-tubulin suppressor-like RCC1 family protein